MPIVSVGRDVLFERLGQTYTDEEFDELCFSFGIELDDVTSERQMYFREVSGRADTADDSNNNNNNNNDNNNNNNNNNNKDPESLSDAVIYKVDIPANRYDLLSLEGLVRALRVFLTLDPLPVWTYSNGGEPVESIVVSPSVSNVRPYVVAAVIRGIKFDEDTYNSFLDFQDKLHFTLCRRRTLVAIGTHDLDTVKGPFRYAAVPSREVRFRPLFQDAELTGPELWSLYEKDAKFSQYMRIHCSGDPDADRHPLITDADGVTLSMPPVINGEHSKLTLDTRNVLIECTATDRIKAHHVLNTLVCNFSEYAGEKLTVERVRIVSEDGSFEELVTPDLTPRVISVPAADVRRVIGHNIPTEQMSSLLTRMQLPTEVAAREKDSNSNNNNNNNNDNDDDDDDDDRDLVVTVPALRTDVLHPIDVIEDVAIAFGYNNLVPRVPATVTVGRAQPVSEVTDLLRSELAMAGFTEALTLVLCRRSELFASMRLRDDGSAVTIANPKGIDYETARCSLGPSLLKTVAANKSAALPLRLFEAADVVIADPGSDVGARNEKRLCAVFADRTGGFEVIHGLLDRIMETLGVNTKDPALSTSEFKYKKGDRHYEIAPAEHRSFFPSRCAEVRVMDEVIGHFGIVHPEVLAAFGITVPTAMLEIKVTPFI